MKLFIDFEQHLDAIFCLPHIDVCEARCECCAGFAGIVISLGWLCWGVHLQFIRVHDDANGSPS